jgi:Glyoxalase-like domain
VELDHVLVAVSDLEEAARALASGHGLASVAGGRHAAWGTANRIVPLGSSYLELVAVDNARTAETTPFGRWVAGSAGGPMGWVVRTASLDLVAGRLGLVATSGSRQLPTGGVLRWRLAGLEEAAAEPCLPFFLEWGVDAPLPGATPVDHPAGDVRLSRLELRGDAGRIAAWLDAHGLPIAVGPGTACVSRVLLEADGRQLALDGPLG